jgi:hypothetical protein
MAAEGWRLEHCRDVITNFHENSYFVDKHTYILVLTDIRDVFCVLETNSKPLISSVMPVRLQGTGEIPDRFRSNWVSHTFTEVCWVSNSVLILRTSINVYLRSNPVIDFEGIDAGVYCTCIILVQLCVSYT